MRVQRGTADAQRSPPQVGRVLREPRFRLSPLWAPLTPAAAVLKMQLSDGVTGHADGDRGLRVPPLCSVDAGEAGEEGGSVRGAE